MNNCIALNVVSELRAASEKWKRQPDILPIKITQFVIHPMHDNDIHADFRTEIYREIMSRDCPIKLVKQL